MWVDAHFSLSILCLHIQTFKVESGQIAGFGDELERAFFAYVVC